ncbi:methyltransferase domain-containing protein [Mumia sp. ZJ430]|uniref:methyltransferase domain-containing protein n=1 Tax=Mumia sp. ZJ430 TaxID=2708083 RepID=UPI00141DCA66|nr:methyltransferase domain-containing protein [Mumia sp. ZJ430]
MRHDTSPRVGIPRSTVPPLCSTALTLAGAGAGRTAVVIGCPNGVEATALLGLGWTVIGIDEDPEVHERVRAAADVAALDRLTTVVGTLPRMSRLPDADLVLTRTALLGDAGPTLWPRVVEALRPGGLLAARLTATSAGLLRGWALLSERYSGPMLEVVARRP